MSRIEHDKWSMAQDSPRLPHTSRRSAPPRRALRTVRSDPSRGGVSNKERTRAPIRGSPHKLRAEFVASLSRLRASRPKTASRTEVRAETLHGAPRAGPDRVDAFTASRDVVRARIRPAPLASLLFHRNHHHLSRRARPHQHLLLTTSSSSLPSIMSGRGKGGKVRTSRCMLPCTVP
jgi:hypothetical protein